MDIIAADLGKFNSMFCFYDSDTREQSTAKAPTDRGYFHSVLKSRHPDLVVVEACGPSGWVSDLCEELKLPILVCSTHEDAWLFKNVKRKTDKDDAIKLAELAALGRLKPTHVPCKEMRERRRLVKYRKAIVGRINKIKNTIRAIFNNQGIKISSGSQTWHSGREQLNAQRKPLDQCDVAELWKGELDLELTQLDSVTKQLKHVDSRLEAIAKSDARVQRVMQIDGVGRVTAEAIVAYIDDAKRFKNANQVGAYAGLVPRQYQSGTTNRLGRITKRGPRLPQSPINGRMTADSLIGAGPDCAISVTAFTSDRCSDSASNESASTLVSPVPTSTARWPWAAVLSAITVASVPADGCRVRIFSTKSTMAFRGSNDAINANTSWLTFSRRRTLMLRSMSFVRCSNERSLIQKLLR